MTRNCETALQGFLKQYPSKAGHQLMSGSSINMRLHQETISCRRSVEMSALNSKPKTSTYLIICRNTQTMFLYVCFTGGVMIKTNCTDSRLPATPSFCPTHAQVGWGLGGLGFFYSLFAISYWFLKLVFHLQVITVSSYTYWSSHDLANVTGA